MCLSSLCNSNLCWTTPSQFLMFGLSLGFVVCFCLSVSQVGGRTLRRKLLHCLAEGARLLTLQTLNDAEVIALQQDFKVKRETIIIIQVGSFFIVFQGRTGSPNGFEVYFMQQAPGDINWHGGCVWHEWWPYWCWLCQSIYINPSRHLLCHGCHTFLRPLSLLTIQSVFKASLPTLHELAPAPVRPVWGGGPAEVPTEPGEDQSKGWTILHWCSCRWTLAGSRYLFCSWSDYYAIEVVLTHWLRRWLVKRSWRTTCVISECSRRTPHMRPGGQADLAFKESI